MSVFTEREQVVEVLNRLFYYTDARQWQSLVDEVFSAQVLLDMTSMGAEKPETLSSQAICDLWKDGFGNLDAVHHQAGTYLIDLEDDEARARGYAIASHYSKEARNGNLREFVGEYDWNLKKESKGWRIVEFTYTLKYTDGNMDLS